MDWFYLPLKNEDKIYTCAGDATMAFISTEDIAALAIKGLTSEKPLNCDIAVHGPELVSHDQVCSTGVELLQIHDNFIQLAEKFSKILGRKIEHVRVTQERRAAMLTEAGFPAAFAQFIAYLEANTWNKEVDEATARVTGKKLVSCDEFIAKHKSAWL